MSDLIILMPTRFDQAWDWGLSTSGQWGRAETDAEKAALASHAFAKLIVVLPGMEVTTKLQTLEGLNDKQRAQAVGFSIEDDLAASLDDTHLAFDNSSSRLAICANDLMDELISTMAGYELYPDIVCADYDCLENTASFCYDGRLIVRSGNGLGSAVETGLAPLILEKDQKIPKSIGADEFLDKIVKSRAAGHQPINLRQGQYTKKAQMGSGRFTRLAALAAVLVIAFVGLNVGQGIYYGNQAKAAKSKIADIYADIFPDAEIPSNPIVPVIRAQADLQGAGGSDFVSLSALLARSIKEVEGVEIASLRYDKARAQISLSLVYGSFEDAERLQAAVAKNGGVFTEGGTRQTGDSLTGDAVFRGGA
jgi:type II secretion system protein L